MSRTKFHRNKKGLPEMLQALHTLGTKEYSTKEMQELTGMPKSSLQKMMYNLLQNGIMERVSFGRNAKYRTKRGLSYLDVLIAFDEKLTVLSEYKPVTAEARFELRKLESISEKILSRIPL